MTTYEHSVWLTPPSRSDGNPWTIVHKWESVLLAGPYTELPTQAFPIDPDPDTAERVRITFTDATLPLAYYYFQFEDAAGVLSKVTNTIIDPSDTAGLLPADLTLDELKRHIDKQLIAEDPLLEQYLIAAFQQAGADPPYGCGRLLLPDPLDDTADPVTRRIRARRRLLIRVPDAREITAVVADGVTIDPSGYETVIRNEHIVALQLSENLVWPATMHHRHPGGPTIVEVTGRFGFATLPMNLREGIYVLAARSYFERGVMYADQVHLEDGAATQVYYRQLPPATVRIFRTFSLPTGYVGLR